MTSHIPKLTLPKDINAVTKFIEAYDTVARNANVPEQTRFITLYNAINLSVHIDILQPFIHAERLHSSQENSN